MSFRTRAGRTGVALLAVGCALIVAGGGSARAVNHAPYVQSSSPVWSPDGSEIAYLSSTGGLPPSLYVMNADGSHKLRLTQIESYSQAWSPDGKTIAFLGRDQGLSSIYVVGADGSNAHAVDGAGPAVLAPRWSPDGSTLLFAKLDDQGASSLYAIPAPGGTAVALAKNSARDAAAAWSPDGTEIAFTACNPCAPFSNTLYAAGADGKGVHRLANDRFVTALAWSPDGKTVAYVAQGRGTGGIALVGRAGGVARSLAPVTGADSGPAWTPDGRSIVYEHASAPTEMKEGAFTITENTRSDVWIMDSNGRHRRALTTDGKSGAAAVSPDGRKIAFTVTDGESVTIDVMNANGSGKHRLS